jgi:hypothetical protein
MVKSESLARGGVMMMTPGENLDFVFLLASVCVSSCGWPGRPVLPLAGEVLVCRLFEGVLMGRQRRSRSRLLWER